MPLNFKRSLALQGVSYFKHEPAKSLVIDSPDHPRHTHIIVLPTKMVFLLISSTNIYRRYSVKLLKIKSNIFGIIFKEHHTLILKYVLMAHKTILGLSSQNRANTRNVMLLLKYNMQDKFLDKLIMQKVLTFVGNISSKSSLPTFVRHTQNTHIDQKNPNQCWIRT